MKAAGNLSYGSRRYLVSWSKERSVTVGIEGAGCVWAPECVYDEQKEAFFVFWASNVKKPGEEPGKHRIFGSYTQDFKIYRHRYILKRIAT